MLVVDDVITDVDAVAQCKTWAWFDLDATKEPLGATTFSCAGLRAQGASCRAKDGVIINAGRPLKDAMVVMKSPTRKPSSTWSPPRNYSKLHVACADWGSAGW